MPSGPKHLKIPSRLWQCAGAWCLGVTAKRARSGATLPCGSRKVRAARSISRRFAPSSARWRHNESATRMSARRARSCVRRASRRRMAARRL